MIVIVVGHVSALEDRAASALLQHLEDTRQAAK
jgi:hypothetical protein